MIGLCFKAKTIIYPIGPEVGQLAIPSDYDYVYCVSVLHSLDEMPNMDTYTYRYICLSSPGFISEITQWIPIKITLVSASKVWSVAVMELKALQ